MTGLSLLNTVVNPLTQPEVEIIIRQWLEQNGCHHIVTANPEILVAAWRDENLRQGINQADLRLVDGAGIVIVAKLLGQRLAWSQRLTGVTLTHLLCRLACDYDLPLLAVVWSGGLSGPLAVEQGLRQAYPRLRFQVASEQAKPSELSQNQAAIVLVGLGPQLQDQWIVQHRPELKNAKIMIGVGGTFDFISGTIRRAPAMLQGLGLEWLWRLTQQPRRWRRIITAVIIFPFLALRHAWHKS